MRQNKNVFLHNLYKMIIAETEIQASFDQLINYTYDYFKESLKSDYLERSLAYYDESSFPEQYHIGVDLHRNDGEPCASNKCARLALEALKPKLFSLFRTLMLDPTVPPPPSLDSCWDEDERAWK